MRRTGYFVSFCAVSASLALTIISQTIPQWLYATSPRNWPAKITVSYGMYKKCEYTSVPLPGSDGKYSSYQCTPFPRHTDCDNGYGSFCTLWSTAGYASQMASVFAVVTLVTILAASCSRARRRSVWKIVAVLVSAQAAGQILAMSLIVDLWRNWDYPVFQYATLSTCFYLTLGSWIADIFIMIGVVTTGLAANSGHTWAAGDGAYRYIGQS